MSATADTQTFLHALYGEEMDHSASILIFTVRPDYSNSKNNSTRIYWAQSVDEAYTRIAGLPDTADIYAGVGLYDRYRISSGRGTAEEVVGMSGFVVDLDYGTVGHKPSSKKKADSLPSTLESVLLVLKDLPYAPTLITHSGHGLHCWWLFNQPWMFTEDKDRSRAAEYSLAWHNRIKAILDTYGYSMDSVFDLPRVMRVAGTINTKPDPEGQKRSTILEYNAEMRYQPEHFDPATVAAAISSNKEPDGKPVPILGVISAPSAEVMLAARHDDELTESCKRIEIRPDSWPPGLKLEELQKNLKFRAAWNRTGNHHDDVSASGHDFALAVFAAQNDWQVQEAANLLVAARKKNQDEMKPDNYFRSTVKRAYERVLSERAHEALLRVDLDAATSDNEEDSSPEAVRKLKLRYISSMLGIRVTRLVRYTGSVPQFHIFTDCGEVLLGDATAIIEQSKFRKLLAGTTLHRIPTYKEADWAPVSQALLSASEDVSRGDESTIQGVVKMWIDSYLRSRPPGTPDACIPNSMTFVDKDGVYIFLQTFQTWLRTNFAVILEPAELGMRLRIYGAGDKKRKTSQMDGRETTMNVWRLPVDPQPYLEGMGDSIPEIASAS